MPPMKTGSSRDWSDLLPDEDYRFHFGLKTGQPAPFFAPTVEHDSLVRQRTRWLEEDPARYAALLPEGVPLLDETLELAREWLSVLPGLGVGLADNFQKLIALGKEWEPEYLLLRPDAQGRFVLVGGCVCFPSSWRLTDKMGRPLEEIHSPVPNLNATLGKSISQFLTRLRPGGASLRSNWSLSRSPELNQHLDQNIPKLIPPLSLADVWMRIENQALVALPKSGGVLFGIRLEIHCLADLKADRVAAQGLARGLRTMPAAMAEYKNLLASREIIAAQLEES